MPYVEVSSSPFCTRPFWRMPIFDVNFGRSIIEGEFLRGLFLWKNRERKKNQPEVFFRPKFCRGRPRGMSVPKCFFFQDLEVLTEVFGRMSAGISGQKLPLWAEFSFLKESYIGGAEMTIILSDNNSRIFTAP